METKAFDFEVKADDAGVIEGYGSIFGNVDKGGDKVMPGAFADSIAQALKGARTIKMLWYHDPTQPIGVWDELVEDGKGLKVKGRIILEVARAKEVLALIKAGVVGGLSIGYRSLKDRMDGDVRLLEKLDLLEVSPVTFPMNDKAKVTSAKAEGCDDIIEKLGAGDRLTEREFEKLAKGLGLSNSQAERAARVHLKGQGEPDKAAKDAVAFLTALRG